MTTEPADSEALALLDELRAEATARLASLDDGITQLRLDRGADTADDEHDPEGVTLSSEWARLVGLRDAAQRDLDDVEAALLRAGEGTYGVCADCGRGIPIARLRARPMAARCVSCAEKAGR